MTRPRIVSTFKEAVADIPDGASIMVGGFAGAGSPGFLVDALYERGARELAIIQNAIGTGSAAGGDLKTIADIIRAGRVRRVHASFTTASHPSRRGIVDEMVATGKIETDLVPQGTLAERIRAAGAGIPAFFTPAGVDTELAKGKECREFAGRLYLMERALPADYALIHAVKADKAGNLVYRLAARNYNAIMAMAARHVVVQAEEIVPVGAIAPDGVHTPGVYVDRLVAIPPNLGLRGVALAAPAMPPSPPLPAPPDGRPRLNHDQIAATATRFIEPGWMINLGFGMPTRICNFVDPDSGVWMTSENGVMGYGIVAPESIADPDVVNAQGDRVLLLPGASIVHHADSFAFIRRGLLDCALLGAYEVASDGSFANWRAPADAPPKLGAIGGAMDLAACAKTVFILMEHTTREGAPRLVERCTLPITAPGCVSLVFTDIAVIGIGPGGLELLEHHPDWTVDEIRARTGAPLAVSPEVKPIAI